MKYIIIGVSILIACLFGGSYLLSFINYGHWLHFPIAMTSSILGIGGIYIIAKGLADANLE